MDKIGKKWDKKDLVRVRVEDTGVETVVCREYAKAYENEGIVYLGEINGVPDNKVPEASLETEMSYEDLKIALVEKGISFKGNAPKEELKQLLEEA